MSDDDVKPWEQIKFPTEEQRQRGRAVINKALGYDFFDKANTPSGDDVMTAFLVIYLNRDYILGWGHD